MKKLKTNKKLTFQYVMLVLFLSMSGIILVTANYSCKKTTEPPFTPTIPTATMTPTIPIDFEGTTINFGTSTFIGFGDAVASVEDNPQTTGNSSAKVAKFTKPNGAQTWAGVTIILNTKIDFSTQKGIKMKVYSPKVGAEVLVKVEHATDPNIFAEVKVPTTKANEWETLEFNFNSVSTSQSYKKISVFMDFNKAGDGAVYYFDDIEQYAVTPTPTATMTPTIPIDFEGTTINFGTSTFIGFGDAVASVEDNPQTTGNSSAKVAKFTKPNGAQTWAGVTIILNTKIDFSTQKGIKMKVHSPKVGAEVLVKVEHATDPNIFAEVKVPTTKANEWETLEFNFSSVSTSQSYKKISVFMDFNKAGDGAVYYFDDIEQYTPAVAQYGVLPIGFEASEYQFKVDDTDSGAFGRGALSIDNNPNTTGNASAKAIKFTKTTGGEAWAGYFLRLTDNINFSSMKKISVKVYSPKVGVKVSLYVEERGKDHNSQKKFEVPTTVANAWETLVFDLSTIDVSLEYNKIGFQFDQTLAADGAIYYIDDITQTN